MNKTTVTALVYGAVNFLQAFGIDLDPQWQAAVEAGILALGLIFLRLGLVKKKDIDEDGNINVG